jgi:tetratricopeptide (TPR) repeat protein
MIRVQDSWADRRWMASILPGIFALALGLRALFLWQIGAAPFRDFLLIDSLEFDQWARRIAGGDLLGSGVFYQAPLYPYFVGLVYALFGPSLTAVRVVQAILGSAACVFLALAGRRFFNPAAGAVAGVLLALHPTAIFFDSLLQRSALDTLFLSLLLWVLGLTLSGPRPVHWLWAGLLLGALSMTRENALVLAPLVVLWLAHRLRGAGFAAIARHLGFLLLGLCLVLAPVAVRNRVAGGQLFLTTSAVGSNFYRGNNARATGMIDSVEELRDEIAKEREDIRERAELALGRPLTPREVSRYWWGRAWDFISTHPGGWLRLMGWKALLLLNALEVSDTYDQYTYGEWSPLLRRLTALLHFGVLLPLGVAGIVLTGKRLREIWVLPALLAAYGASVILFMVSTRYRYPLVLPLVLFAAAGLRAAAGELRAGRWRTLVPALALAVGAAILANWPVAPRLRQQMRAVMLNNVAAGHLRQQGGAALALPLLEQVVRDYPALVSGAYNLALALRELGRPAEAAGALEGARRLSPSATICIELGTTYLLLNREADAVRSVEAALEQNPRSAGALYNLALLLERQGRAAEAAGLYTRFLAIRPDYAPAHTNLGAILYRSGKTGEAIRHFRAAIRADPAYPPARYNLAVALKGKGHLDEAVGQFESGERALPIGSR